MQEYCFWDFLKIIFKLMSPKLPALTDFQFFLFFFFFNELFPSLFTAIKIRIHIGIWVVLLIYFSLYVMTHIPVQLDDSSYASAAECSEKQSIMRS